MTIPESGLTTQFDELNTQLEQLEGAFQPLIASAAKRELPNALLLPRLMNTTREALKNAHAQAQRLTMRRAQLHDLVHTSALLTSSLELDHVLEEVMDTVIRLAGAERGYLMLRDETTGELNSRAARNWDREAISPEDVQVSLGVIDVAIQQKTPVITTNAQLDPRFKDRLSVVAQHLRAIVCVPLILRDQSIGVLYADNRTREGQFDQNMMVVMTAFANQAAIAIENARLFEQVQRELIQTQQQARQIIIQIDEGKTNRHLDDIMNSDFFKKLRDAATDTPDETD